MVNDTIAESGKAASVAEFTTFDSIKDFGEVRVELEVAIVVGVAEILDVFCQIAKEEDVGFANLAGNFDLPNY